MGRGLFEPWHLILLVALVAVLFGWKKLPDITRSVGRSMRIFKSEVSEMKNDGKETRPSAAATDTVAGDVVPPQTTQAAPGAPAPQPPVTQPAPAYQPASQCLERSGQRRPGPGGRGAAARQPCALSAGFIGPRSTSAVRH